MKKPNFLKIKSKKIPSIPPEFGDVAPPECYRAAYYESEYYQRGLGPELEQKVIEPLVKDVPVRVCVFPGVTPSNWNQVPPECHQFILVINLSHVSSGDLGASLHYFLSWGNKIFAAPAAAIDMTKAPKKVTPPPHVQNYLQNGAKLTIVCTHEDVLIEGIKTGALDMRCNPNYQGPKDDWEKVAQFVIDEHLLVVSSYFTNKAKPDIIRVNGLDRDDVVEKLGHLFGNVAKWASIRHLTIN